MSSNTFRFLLFCGVLITLPSKLLEFGALVTSLLDHVWYDCVKFSEPTPFVICSDNITHKMLYCGCMCAHFPNFELFC
jgi:hypothetical protein